MILTAIPWQDVAALSALLVILLLLSWPFGLYIASVVDGRIRFLSFIENNIYKLCAISPNVGMNWKEYCWNFVLFSFLSFLALFVTFMLQNYPDISVSLAFNQAAAFISGTNWQPHIPETTVTPLTQMLGLAVHHFLAAALALSVFAAFIRGLRQTKSDNLGNFWSDVVRFTLYIFLPVSFVIAIFLVSQGVVQTFGDLIITSPIGSDLSQTIATGPVASQTAIKQFGTNGGGYFNANAAHPFENPTPLSAFVQLIAILLIPTASAICFGKMINDARQGNALLWTMFLFFIPLALITMSLETAAPQSLSTFNLSFLQGNMEGKEVRFGAAFSALWSSVNTATATGSTISALATFQPLSILIYLLFIQIGEVIFGGAGIGFVGLIVYVLLAVFISGLLIGRAPQYLGKRIGASEIKIVSLILILPTFITLVGAAMTVFFLNGDTGTSGQHHLGLTEIIYAFSSASFNNGTALSSLQSNSDYYNIALGISMLATRIGVMALMLALAGSLSDKKTYKSHGAISTASPVFVFFLITIIVFIGIPTFVPSLMLGPVAEHLHLITAGGV